MNNIQLELNIEFENGNNQQLTQALPICIGRDNQQSLQIKSFRVSKQHARIFQQENEVFIEDFGAIGGTSVNHQRINHHGPLKTGDQIIIGPALFTIKKIISQINSLEQNPIPQDVSSSTLEPEPITINMDDSANILEENSLTMSDVQKQDVLQWRQDIQHNLLDELNLRRHDISSLSDQSLRLQAKTIVDKLIQEKTHLTGLEAKHLCQEILNEAIGLGVLEPLLANPHINEIMVNCFNEIYVEERGKLVLSKMQFSSEETLRRIIERIVMPLGRRIDDSSPMVDARLPDGSRVNAVIAPIALKGSCLTIRKFPSKRPLIDDLLLMGSLDEPMAQFLAFCVKNKKNMVISGGTGSGKTTLLNILSNFIPLNERIITIEDAAELKLNHPHLIAMEARPANIEGQGTVSIRDLVKNALRMRPDRIVIGECRGQEAFDMMNAMNTGHEGSLTTLHANSARDALSRLETMVLMAGMDLPLAAIREHIASSIDFIVQQNRLVGGSRKITTITEICGIEGGVIKSQDIFIFDRKNNNTFCGTGVIPECFNAGSDAGMDLNWFNQRNQVQEQHSFT